MKFELRSRNGWMLWALVLLHSSFILLHSQHLYINLVDQGLGLQSATNRTVLVTGNSLPKGVSSGVVLQDKHRLTTDVEGGCWISNAVPGVYFVDVIKPSFAAYPAERTTFYVLHTNTTGITYAREAVAANPGNTLPPDSVAWGAATSDARFVKRAELTNLVQNIPGLGGGVSNNQVLTGIPTATNALFAGNFSGSLTGRVWVTGANTSWSIAGYDGGGDQWLAFLANSNLSTGIFFKDNGNIEMTGDIWTTGKFIGDGTALSGTLTNNTTGNAATATTAIGLSATMTNFLFYIQTNNLPIFDVTRFGAYPGKPSNTTNIQAAIEAAGAVATEARPAVVYIPRGDYPCDPYETVFGSGRTSEAHQSVLTIWTNNIYLVGDGKNATKLRATRDGPSGVMNFIGAGSSVAASDAYTRYTSNIILAGIEFDADGYEFECTQIFNPVNWLAIDCRTRGAAWRSGNSFDGWDTQGEIGFTFVDCEAVDCSGNGFGVSSGTSTNVFLFNIRTERCGTTTAANGGALQFVQNPPPKVRGLIAKSCGTLVTPGSYFDIEDAIIVVTNTTAKTNIYIGSPFGGTLRNVRFEAVPNTAAPLIAVAGGYVTLENVKADNVTWRAIHMTSGSATVKDGSVLGATGAQTPLEASGGTLTVENSTLYANTSARDIILTSGGTAALIVRNCKFGGTGIAANVGGFLIENSVFNYGTIFANGAGVIRGNSFLGSGNAFNISGGTNFVSNNYFGASSSISIAGGTPFFQNNYFATSTYSRSGGSPTFLGGNIFSANALAMSVTLGAFRPGVNSVTPTASYTLFTNTTYFPLRLHWYGGTLTGYGLNGTQLGTGAGSVMVTPGDWVGITNTDTTGHVIRWSVY